MKKTQKMVMNTSVVTIVVVVSVLLIIQLMYEPSITGRASTVGCKESEVAVSTLDDFIAGKQLSKEVYPDMRLSVMLSDMRREFFDNPHVISEVEGYGIKSNLYNLLSKRNADEIFQFNLEDRLGQGIYGGKAVAYINDDGSISVAFLTESEKTHHRHALGTIIGGEKGRLVYNGEYHNYLVSDMKNRAFGFQFQFDKIRRKVLRVEHSSQITNLQKSKGISGWVLQTNAVSTVERLLLESIDPDLFDESFFIRPLEQWVDRSKLPLSP